MHATHYTKSRMLPFLILFECKIIGEEVYRDLRNILIGRNYAVSNYGNDCFAILKPKPKALNKEDKMKKKGIFGLLG